MPETLTGLKVEVDRDACMGLGQCIVYASKSFAHDASTKAVFTGATTADDEDAVRAAVEACPTGALSLIES